MVNLAVVSLALAGGIHLGLVPEHFEHSPAHGIFFAIVGVAEILWAFVFWRRPGRILYYIGVGLSGGLIVLWAVTRVFPAPFEHTLGEIDLAGIVCKLVEFVGLVALVSWALRSKISGIKKQSMARVALVALLVALVSGLFSFGVGHAAEPFFPSLSGGHEESGSGTGDHDESNSNSMHVDPIPADEENNSEHDE